MFPRNILRSSALFQRVSSMSFSNFLRGVWRDLQYGGRLLLLNPGFAIVAVLSLALGIGANTAIFQLLDAVRIRTLPVSHPEQLVEIRVANSDRGRTGHFISRRPMLTYALWEQLRDRQQAFSGLAVWGTAGFELAAGGESRPAQGLWVNGDFFTTLGVPPLIGRTLTPADDTPGCSALAAVVSYGFWQREFGGSQDAIGKRVVLDGHAYDVVGVTPASFHGPEVGRTFDVAVPICAEPYTRGSDTALNQKSTWFLAAFGRLKLGWTIHQTHSHLAAISKPIFAATLPAYSPEDAKAYLDFKLGAFPAATGVSNLRGSYESPLWLLLATTALVLLVACANLANLMLARATGRERELAIRHALGASRGRIIRQLVAESFILAAIGAASGALLARWLSQFLVGFLTTSNSGPTIVDLAFDWRVLTFAAALGVATCVVFGLLPALRVTATRPTSTMIAGSRGLTDSPERFALRRVLVVTQVAFSLVLIVGALLFVRSLRNLITLDPGFRQEGILVATLDLRPAGIPEGRRESAFQEIVEHFRRLPGVASAAQVIIPPVSGYGWNNKVLIDGKKYAQLANFNSVSDEYFKTMEISLLDGRDFNRSDTASSAKVAIVTKSFTKLFFAGANPIGRTFQIDVAPGEPQPIYEIIGVSEDVKYTDLREEFRPLVYLATMQDEKAQPFLQVVIKCSAPMSAASAEILTAMRSINTSTIVQFTTLESQVRDSLLRERLMATLSGFFGALAALIATVGLYGVMSYTVLRRQHEIGIRMVLGANRGDVVHMIVRDTALLLGAGLAIGGVMSVAAARIAESLLYGVRPQDPKTLFVAMSLLAAAALIASYLPALRASKLQPAEALRQD
jgi:putative ABC transport system permease protein